MPHFPGSRKTGLDAAGQEWVFPRYGAAITPGVVAGIIRAARAAGWDPAQTCPPPFERDGESFFRLPPDPTQSPPGGEGDLKQRFRTALHVAIQSVVSGSPANPQDSIGPTSRQKCPPTRQVYLFLVNNR